MNIVTELTNLKSKMNKDINLPLRESATQLVFGSGNPDSKILFLGEAPGKFEDLKGIPFVGAAGKLLDKLLATINLKREDIYITNVVKFRPPNNRPPTPKEIESFREYLNQEIDIINPKVIITLGRFAMEKFLPNQKISQIHGQKFDIDINGQIRTLVPMFHPAAALRATKVRKLLEEDFKRIPAML